MVPTNVCLCKTTTQGRKIKYYCILNMISLDLVSESDSLRTCHKAFGIGSSVWFGFLGVKEWSTKSAVR